MRIGVVAVLVTFLASSAIAQECSVNGRFCLHREWSEEEGTWAGFTISDELFSPGKIVGRLALKDPGGQALVSNDGRFIVFAAFDDPAVTILRSDGTSVATLPLRDLLTDHDINLVYSQEPKWSLDGDRLMLSILTSGNPKIETRANLGVDLRNGRVLTAKRDLIEPLLPSIRPAATKLEKPWNEPRCIDGAAATFATAGLPSVDSAIFLSNAVDTPLNEYPNVANKARISGVVRVEAIVDEAGRVLCVRTTRLAFGIDTSAQESVLRWQFRRIRTGATIAPVRGMFDLVYELGRVAPLSTAGIQ